MVTYPVRISAPPYRGSKPALRQKAREKAQLADALESYINERMEGQEVRTFYYGIIAIDLSIPVDQIKDLLFALDSGHNGLTVCTPEYWNREVVQG